MAKAMLGCSGFFCSPSLLSGPCLPSCSLWSEYPPVLGYRASAVWGLEGAGLTQLSTARGRKVPFPLHAHILQPGAAWDAPAQLLGLWMLQQHCAGRDNLEGWGGGCAGVQLWERSWVSPGSAVPSLCIRGFGDSSSFSHDAQGYRVQLAVCNFVGLQVGHLLTSVTLR